MVSSRSLQDVSGFSRYWLACSVSEFGTYFTTLAIQVLIVVQLGGTATEVGLVNAGRWLPYLLFGLFAGVFIDRVRRRPVLITADLARGMVLLAVTVSALTDRLSIAALIALMAVFGVFSLGGDVGSQALLPSMVPPQLLTPAHARLDQSSAVAQTSGPGLAGALVALVGAPWAVLVDAVSYFVSGAMVASIKVAEPMQVRAPTGTIRSDLTEGLRWVYRHPTLAPMALTTHLWFIFSAIAGVVMVPFVLDTVELGPFALGLAFSLAGVGALVGSSVAAGVGAKFGVGRVVAACHLLAALAFAVMALAVLGWGGWVLVGTGQLLLGLSMGASNANEMGYRQTVTPDRLQGRMNATIRSTNRAMIVIAAPLGGLLADAIGYRTTLWIVAAGMLTVALAVRLSRFWAARI